MNLKTAPSPQMSPLFDHNCHFPIRCDSLYVTPPLFDVEFGANHQEDENE
jgi:hypothetical protein